MKKIGVARNLDEELLEAVAHHDFEKTKALLKKGADVNARDAVTGFSIVHFAVINVILGKWRINNVALLLAHGAYVNTRARDGFTALHIAVVHDDVELTKFLLTKGARINAQDSDGLTPLHYAIMNHAKKMSKFLRDYGADENIRDKHGWSAARVPQKPRWLYRLPPGLAEEFWALRLALPL